MQETQPTVETVEASSIGDFLNERDNPVLKEKIESSKEAQEKIEDDNDEEQPEQKIKSPQSSDPAPKMKKQETGKDEDKKDDAVNSSSSELETLKKRFEDGQNYSKSLKQSKDNALSYVHKLIDNGDISEEHAQDLINILKLKNIKEPAGLSDHSEQNTPSHPFQKFYDIANQDVIQTYLEVTEDETYREKVRAFDAFMTDSTKEELEDLYQELSGLEKKPVALLKRMLVKGQEYLDEGYGEFMKSGGFREYSRKKTNELEILQNKVDKLQKKIAKYETYDKPSYDLEESTLSKNEESSSGDTFGDFFNQRDTIKRR